MGSTVAERRSGRRRASVATGWDRTVPGRGPSDNVPVMELPIYRSAVRQFGQRVDQVRDHQWDLSTPDPRWTVGGIVDAMTERQSAVAAALAVLGTADVPSPARSTTGRAAGWAAASAAAVGAFGAVSDWSVSVDAPDGTVAADELLWRTATELSIHTWDVARAIGGPDELPNDLLAHVLDQARAHGERWFDADRYAPPIPVPGCTEDLIELLALAGRNRWWRRPA